MKRSLLIAPLLLTACGGGQLSLSLTSDDMGASALGGRASSDLTTVRSLRLTVDEVWVHLADAEDAREDGEAGWRRVTDADQSFDLMTVRGDATLWLGDFPLPEGQVTQVRLKLRSGATTEGARVSLPGAVVEQDGTVCDLSLPASAFEPGLKLSGTVEAMRIDSGGHHRALINLTIKDSARLSGAACAYTLEPVLKVKRLQPGAREGGDLL
jgi:hypothetical protein